MASWYASIVTKTSSQISSLRSTLLSSEADGDTDDDTHVCRVLRNYYTDKGRPRPAWLPADPKAPQPPPQALYVQPTQPGARYGGLGTAAGGGPGGIPASTSLASLWDSGPSGGPQAPAPPASLRAGRAPPGGNHMLHPNGREDVAARPLPSQRTGSYQSVSSQGGGAGGGGATAQDRLKQRLWGGARSASPAAAQNQNPYGAPPPGGGGGGQYDARGGRYSNGGGVGGGGDPYGRGGGGGQQRQGLPSGPRGYR